MPGERGGDGRRRPTAVDEIKIGTDTATPIGEVEALARRMCEHNEVWTKPWAHSRTRMVGDVNVEGSGSDESEVWGYMYLCVGP